MSDKRNMVVSYVPHGINQKSFFPIHKDHQDYGKLLEYKQTMFGGKEYDFVVFYNSRNIHRKRPGDVILAYRDFCDRIGKEKAKRTALIMHTQAIDNNGTDLRAVKQALTDPEYVNIYFSQSKLDTGQMNILYNIADVTVLMSSNEGWGLALTESMMAGTMIIANTTGGMQDQMRFEDENDKWIEFTEDFPSNHRGTFKKHGRWAVPVYPSNISLAGSPATPYIFDDRCSFEDVAKAIQQVYDLTKEERDSNGQAGREWVLSNESQMSAKNMCKNIIEVMDKGFEMFTPRSPFDLIKVGESKDRIKVQNITNY